MAKLTDWLEINKYLSFFRNRILNRIKSFMEVSYLSYFLFLSNTHFIAVNIAIDKFLVRLDDLIRFTWFVN